MQSSLVTYRSWTMATAPTLLCANPSFFFSIKPSASRRTTLLCTKPPLSVLHFTSSLCFHQRRRFTRSTVVNASVKVVFSFASFCYSCLPTACLMKCLSVDVSLISFFGPGIFFRRIWDVLGRLWLILRAWITGLWGTIIVSLKLLMRLSHRLRVSRMSRFVFHIGFQMILVFLSELGE